MTRRILFCTIGQTPQVVTETVWALTRDRKPPWAPDEIHIVTTSVGLPSVRKELQDPTGRLAPLFAAKPPPVTIYVPRRDGGADVYGPPRAAGDWKDDRATEPPSELAAGTDAGPLADVNSGDDAALMGDLILRLMAGFVQDEDTEVHLSLAGGRKTMSAHALLAMTLVGRVRDEASHVLVSPADFEDNRQFWHRDQGGRIHSKAEQRQNPMPPPSLDPSAATVTLVPTPTPLIRHRVKDATAIASLTLAATIAEHNLAAKLDAAPHVFVDTRENVLDACGVRHKLGAKSFAIYRLAATACKEQWPGVGPDGDDRAEDVGWLSVPYICIGHSPDGTAIEHVVLRFIKEAVAVEGGDPEDEKSVNEWRDGVVGARQPRIKLANAQAWFAHKTRLGEAITEKFGAPAAARVDLTEVNRRQKRLLDGEAVNIRGATRFGLLLPPSAIEIA